MSIYLHTGWTEPINDQLLADGAAVNLTGMTVEIEIRDASGAVLTKSGTVSVVDASLGKVRFSPASGDIVSTGSPWRVWWKVTASGKVAFFPDRVGIQWFIS